MSKLVINDFFLFPGFGISEPIGHVDFYPNGGSTQPGCKQSDSPNQSASYQQVVKYVGCNHERSHEYFTESIAPTCPFMAIQCESHEVSNRTLLRTNSNQLEGI